MIGIDTNVLVRYIVQDDPAQARLATKFIESTLGASVPGFIGDIVLCELVWVLESAYGYERIQIADVLERLLEIDRLQVENTDFAWRALDAYRDGTDFSDALLALGNAAQGCEYTATFDKRAARYGKFKLLTR